MIFFSWKGEPYLLNVSDHENLVSKGLKTGPFNAFLNPHVNIWVYWECSKTYERGPYDTTFCGKLSSVAGLVLRALFISGQGVTLTYPWQPWITIRLRNITVTTFFNMFQLNIYTNLRYQKPIWLTYRTSFKRHSKMFKVRFIRNLSLRFSCFLLFTSYCVCHRDPEGA